MAQSPLERRPTPTTTSDTQEPSHAASRADDRHPGPPPTRFDRGLPTLQSVVHLQRTIGNRAVVSMLGETRPTYGTSGASGTVQRDPIVWHPNQNKRVDAAGWTDTDLDNWQKWYDGQTPEAQLEFLKDNNAVLKMVADRQNAEAAFKQAKQALARPHMKEEMDEALALLFGLLSDDSTRWVFNDVNPQKAVTELSKAIQDPGAMNQADFPLCGPDTYLRIFAIHHPLEYVRYAISLLKTGTGQLGKQVVKAPDEVRARKTFSENIHISEWIMTASLRSQTNFLFKAITEESEHAFGGKYLAGLSGGTTVSEMRNWFLATGIPDKAIASDDFSLSLFGANGGTLATINGFFRQGRRVALSIHNKIVDNPIDHPIESDMSGLHFVTLASTIELTGKNYIADAYTWGGAKTLRFRSDQIGRAVQGFVAVDLTQFTPHGAKQKGEKTVQQVS